MMIKLFEVEEQVSMVSAWNYVFMFKDFQWTISVYISIHIESNYNTWFTGSRHLTSIALVNK